MKILKRVLLSTLIITLLFTSLVGANTILEQIQVARNTVKITVNGNEIQADNFVYEGRTYIQMREIAETLGKEVGWNGETKTASINDMSAKLTPTPEPTVQPTPEPTPTVKPTVKPTPTPVKSKELATRENPFEMLERLLITEKDGTKYSMYVMDVIRGSAAAQKIANENRFNKKADYGKEFVIVAVGFELIKSEGPYYMNDFLFDMVSENGVLYDTYNSRPTIVLEPELSSVIYEGGKTGGYIVFEIDKDDKAPLLVYDMKYDGTGGLWFKTTK